MVASATDSEQRLVTLAADLASAQKLCKKLDGKCRERDNRIKDLEQQLKGAQSRTGMHSAMHHTHWQVIVRAARRVDGVLCCFC
jgi:hypothetical protein